MSTDKKKKRSSKNYNSEMLVSSKTSFYIAEAYKTLRANLMFSVAALEEDVPHKNIFVLTSSLPGEGKSISSANLSIVFAQTGSKILLIDADLRKPVQNKLFAASNVRGLSTVLVGETVLDVAIKKEVRPNLDLLSSGKIPSNPSELLGSKAMRDLLDELSAMYDYIISDTPPLNVVADALTFASDTAGLLLAVCPAICNHDHLKKSVENAKLANINILGAFLSNTSNQSLSLSYNSRYGRYGKYYYRTYGY